VGQRLKWDKAKWDKAKWDKAKWDKSEWGGVRGTGGLSGTWTIVRNNRREAVPRRVRRSGAVGGDRRRAAVLEDCCPVRYMNMYVRMYTHMYRDTYRCIDRSIDRWIDA
jgi:hypothetical protein